MDLTQEEIELAALEQAALLHPDGEGDAETEAALAMVNEARAVLANPETRAIALLEALGGPSASEDRTLPDGFLMEMMSTREAIDEAIAKKDSAEVARWVAWGKDARARHVERVSGLLKGDATAVELKQARKELNAWRYIERLLEQVGSETR